MPSYYTGYTWTSSQSIRWGTNTVTSVGLPVGVGANSDYAFATTFTGTTPYDAQGAAGIRWDDPSLAIDWPLADPILSARDRALPCLA